MLTEVQKIHGIEHDFLLGFYYRLQGRPADAMERLSRCLNDPMVAQRAKREFVESPHFNRRLRTSFETGKGKL